MRILLFLLLLSPLCASAQILRAYGVIEIGSFPTSSTTGPKFAYRPVDSSFYRWVSGNTWVKVVESSITQDTIYLTEQLGTTVKVSGDTINLTPYLLKSDTMSMLVRYIERGDTASMLTNYPSTAGYGIIDGGKTWRADTTSPNGLATRKYTILNPTSIIADRSIRSNGTNLVAGSWDDNLIRLLARVPVQFQSWTTAGRPTGVNGYIGDNSTNDWIERYSSTAGAWISPLQSSLTAGKGTAGRVLFVDVNGRATDSGNLTWNETTGKQLSIISNSTGARGVLIRQTTNDIIGVGYNIQRIRGSSAVQAGDFIGSNVFSGFDGSQYSVDNCYFGAQVTGAVSAGIVPTSIIFAAGSSTNYVPSLLVHHNSNVGIGNFGIATSGPLAAPAEKLEVRGNIRNDGVVNSIITPVNAARFSTIQNYNNGTSSRTGYYAIAGASSGVNSVFVSFQAFPPAFSDAIYGGSYIASSGLFTSLSRKGASNSYLHFATGSDQSTVDTAEFVFHRNPQTQQLSSLTRIGAITNRGIQVSGTTTAGRLLSKANQYWISYNTDSIAFNYRDNSGWHIFATRAYVRSLISALPATWLKPSLEAGSININQGRVNKLRFNQDSGYFHLKNGVIFLQHPTEKDLVNYGLPQVIITSDTLARWDKSGSVVSIGSRLGSGNRTGYGYTMVGSLTRGVVNGFDGYFSSAIGYDVSIDSTIKVNAVGHKITANRIADSDAYGGYITFSKNINNSGAYGSVITINRNKSFVYGRGISTRHENEFLYGSTFSPKHTFLGSKLMVGEDSTFSFSTSTDVLQLSQMGAGNKEASDLSKTQSAYIAGFATDGTLLDLGIGSGLKKSGGTLDLKRKSLIDSLPLNSVAIDASDNDFGITGLANLDFESEGGSTLHLDDDNFNVEVGTEINLSTQSDASLHISDYAQISAPGAEGAIDFKIDTDKYLWNFVNSLADPDTAMVMDLEDDKKVLQLNGYGQELNTASSVGNHSGMIAGFTTKGKVHDFFLNVPVAVSGEFDMNATATRKEAHSMSIWATVPMSGLDSTVIILPDPEEVGMALSLIEIYIDDENPNVNSVVRIEGALHISPAPLVAPAPTAFVRYNLVQHGVTYKFRKMVDINGDWYWKHQTSLTP